MTAHKLMKWIRWLLAIAILVTAGLTLRHFMKRPGGSTSTYITTTVTRTDLTQIVTATGQLNPVTTVQVGSQISGIIQKLFVDFNSPVTKDQVIAQIDPSIYQANAMQAEGDLANARAGLALARANLIRAEKLFAQNAAPQATLDQTTAAYSQAEALVKIKEGALQKAQVDLAHCTIYAPIDGSVISRSVDVGQTVAASLSAPILFTIANDLTKMQIDANVAEADIGSVEIDQTVRFTVDAFPFRSFTGRVRQVRNAPTTVQNVVTYDTVIDVDNPELKLKPGMTANVSIIIAQREGVLAISNAALRFRPPEEATSKKNPDDGSHPKGNRGGRNSDRRSRTVYILPEGAGKPQGVQIQIGITDGVSTEVVEGLKEGDRIITGTRSGAAPGPTGTPNPFGGGMRRF